MEQETIWREQQQRLGGPVRPLDQHVDAVLAATEPAAAEAAATDRGDSDSGDSPPLDPFKAARPEQGRTMDLASEQFTGIVPGIGLASFRDRSGVDRFLILPGDDVKVTFPTAGTPPKAVSNTFTVVDFYESKMSEYDANFVFVPLENLQQMRGMIEPETGIGSVNSIQIKLAEGADLEAVRDRLRQAFPPELYAVSTWRDKQGPLLSAVDMEMAVLNILLFLIVAVAGFGILAIFFMIVVEKTRDIGILKAIGRRLIGDCGDLPGLWPRLGGCRRRRGNGSRPGDHLEHQPDSASGRVVDWPAGVRPVDLLLLQHSHHCRPLHGLVDHRRGCGDCRGGKCAAGLPCRAAASGGGTAA